MSENRSHQKKVLMFLFFLAHGILLLFRTGAYAGSLTFTPDGDPIDFGDIYIGQWSYFTLTIVANGDCSGAVSIEEPYPKASQSLANYEFDLSSGENIGTWIGVAPIAPGDDLLYLKIDSTCGIYYKTISFHTIGYGYVQGSVTDATSEDPIPTAVVKPGNPYLMEVLILSNGNYNAKAYPGYHWLIANAAGYIEKMVNIEIREGDTITYDFQLDPDIAGKDTDSDGILDDGDNSGKIDNFCGDGITTDCDDNCTLVSNLDQKDTDSDGMGDACDEDDDDDGMPDSWELQYGLNPLDSDDAALDADKDGFTNHDEFVQGSDPTNRNDPRPRAFSWLPLLLE